MRYIDDGQPHVLGGGEAVQQQQRRRGVPRRPAAAVTEAVVSAVRVADQQPEPLTPEPAEEMSSVGSRVTTALL